MIFLNNMGADKLGCSVYTIIVMQTQFYSKTMDLVFSDREFLFEFSTSEHLIKLIDVRSNNLEKVTSFLLSTKYLFFFVLLFNGDYNNDLKVIEIICVTIKSYR